MKKQAYFLLFLSALLWGSSFPVIKFGLNRGIDPISFLTVRLFIASILIIPFIKREINLKVFTEKKILLLGITNAGGFFFQYIGQKYTFANNAAVIANLIVIFVAVLSFIILKERFGIFKVSGVILSFIGLILVSGVDPVRLNFNKGDLIMLLSPILWSFFVILSKDISDSGSIKKYLFPIYFLTFLFLIPMTNFSKINFNLTFILLILYLAIFCTIVPYMFFLKAMRTVSATTATIITSFEIIFSIIIAYFLLGETIGLRFLVGLILIFTAIVLVEKKQNFEISK
jgi:drug/metabolite transporter (DMT)-like permease